MENIPLYVELRVVWFCLYVYREKKGRSLKTKIRFWGSISSIFLSKLEHYIKGRKDS